MNLDDIGLKYGTDKASNGHNYLHFYERILGDKTRHVRLLEIGVQFNLSLRTWAEYFDQASISGIDHIDNGSEFNIYIGNAYAQEMILRLGVVPFDIIIDDGSHNADDIRWFLSNYHRLLAPEGIMIVEDCRMSWTTYCVHKALPEGWQWSIVDFTTISPLPDSTLILAWKP